MSLLKSDISKNNISSANNSISNFLSKYNRQYNIIKLSFCIITIVYLVGIGIINKQLNSRIDLANKSIDNTNARINEVRKYNKKLNDRIDEYETLIKNIESINNANSEDKRFKNTIPNLLNNIMAVIPKNVQLTSIENTSGTHIVINARSSRYEQIAFFKTKLKVEGILENVVSDTGIIQGGYLSVTIEGELP